MDLDCVQKVLDNIEAKFDDKPMPSTVALPQQKDEVVHKKKKRPKIFEPKNAKIHLVP